MKVEPVIQPINPRPLHTEVADRLRDLIVYGELAPGDRLNERTLTERYRISRTPLREAIKMLAAEGLVQLLPNRGAIVTGLTRKSALDIFQVMTALESLTGKLACERATDKEIAEITALHERMRVHHKRRQMNEYFRLNLEIHQRIIDCTQNAELADIYRKLSVRVRRLRYMSNFSRDQWDAAMAEHEQILEALTQRNAKRLKALLATHLENKFRVTQDSLATAEAEAERESAGE